MSFRILPTLRFQKDVKKLIKKYPSLKDDIKDLLNELSENPAIGIPLGNDCYKIRLSISSKGRGKSGGGRAVTYVLFKSSTVYLLTLYDKSDQSSISDNEIREMIDDITSD